MSENEFWNLIATARRSVPTATETELTHWLIAYLQEKPISEIADFGRHFREASLKAYDLRLWAAATAICNYCSDDVFSDFCAWLIAQGKEVYDKALVDPDSLADLEGFDGGNNKPRFESFSGVADRAYKIKTGGGDLGELIGVLPASAWQLKNENIWDGEPVTLKKLVPRLYEKFPC